jgi:hypothetical protein
MKNPNDPIGNEAVVNYLTDYLGEPDTIMYRSKQIEQVIKLAGG